MYPAITLLSLLLLSSLLFLLITSIKNRRTAHATDRSPLPPSPSKLPVLGNLQQLGPLLHRSLHALSAKHGPLMLLQLGRVPTLIVSSPAAAQQVLKDHDLIFASRPALKASRIIFYGTKDMAFAPYGEYWRQMRKLCATHLFSVRMVQSFRSVRESEMTRMMKKIARSARLVPLTGFLKEFASDLICRAVLGSAVDGEGRKKLLYEMIHANSVLFETPYFEDFFPALRWLDVLLGLEGRLTKNFRRWDDMLEEAFEGHVIGAKKGERVASQTNFAHVLLSLQDNWKDYPLEKDHIKALLMVFNLFFC